MDVKELLKTKVGAGAYLRGAYLYGANLSNIITNKNTIMPKGCRR